MRNFLVLFLSLVLLTDINIHAQGTNKIIAKVGDQKISEREFKLRYELVPHFSRDQFNVDSSKQDLLNSIIAEKLLSLEAGRLGYDTTDYYKYSIEQIKDLYLRDELYKKAIDSKVKIKDSEVQKALDRGAKSLSVRIISSEDSSKIFHYYSLLLNGAPFDSIEKISDPVEYDSNKSPIRITYGQMRDDYVEDTLYSLRIGRFSSPVRTEGGWFIFKLVGINSQVAANAKIPDYNQNVLKIIRMKKSKIIGVKYLSNFYKDKKATVDSTMFLRLSEKISSILTEKKENNDFGRDNLLFLDEGNIMNILNYFGEAASDRNLVHIEKYPINLKEYLYSLIIYPLLIKDPSLGSVEYFLMDNLNKYIQYKFLAEEGAKKGYANNPDVKEDINIWSDDYLAKMLKNSFRDSIKVTDEELKNFYREDRLSEEVNISEILTDNLETVETVFKELEKGKDFRELAKKYTQANRQRNGETGYVSVNSLGELGMFAAKMKLNQVYGPIKTDSGYSVIKLLGRRTDTAKTVESFDSVKSRLKSELMTKKFNKKFFKYIAGLADKYQITVNEANLKNLKVINIPMFTFKYIGFGGRIAAVPYLGGWYEWINYLKDKSRIIP